MTTLNPQTEPVKVYTLGRFVIKRGERTLSDVTSRSKKAWELFKYLIAHKDKTAHPELVLETLWPEQNYADPNVAMRALVYRLRQILEKELAAPELAANITCSHGCYKWEQHCHCWLDIDQFESLCAQAQRAAGEAKPEEAIAAYQEAVSLYLGDFLPDCAYQEWVLPARNHYRRLYLQAVIELAELLRKGRRFAEIIEICEAAIPVEYYEEELHLRYMEALLAEGKNKQARAHYDEVTAAFYRDLGAKPSPAMRSLFQVLRMDYDNFDLDLSVIQESLRDRKAAQGAFYCDRDTFRHFYRLERLRSERSGQVVFLGLLSVTLPDYRLPSPPLLEEVMNCLQEVMLHSLRKGDLVTRWNKAQFLILLPGVNKAQSELILKRIEHRFKKVYPTDRIILHKKQQPVLPAEQFLA
ncbi:MAG: diguanylate cyclase [Firmicutes bacterium]|nr:diguanylate cyclase [Bacillota bacterium]